jgi:hypothetical protein
MHLQRFADAEECALRQVEMEMLMARLMFRAGNMHATELYFNRAELYQRRAERLTKHYNAKRRAIIAAFERKHTK